MSEQAPEDEPGQVGDPDHGIPGPAEPMPEGDASAPAPEPAEEAEEDAADDAPEQVEEGVQDDQGTDDEAPPAVPLTEEAPPAEAPAEGAPAEEADPSSMAEVEAAGLAPEEGTSE